MYIHICVCMYACVFTHTHESIDLNVCAYIYVCICMNACLCMGIESIDLNVCAYICALHSSFIAA
jgi:hypothetical protein